MQKSLNFYISLSFPGSGAPGGISPPSWWLPADAYQVLEIIAEVGFGFVLPLKMKWATMITSPYRLEFENSLSKRFQEWIIKLGKGSA